MEKMKILATCQYGWPEPYPSLFPMEEMVKRGHSVHAVIGMPNYPMGDFLKGYERNQLIEERHEGVLITHVPVIPRKHDAFHRLLNYHSYPHSAKKYLANLKCDYDVVFANQSSPVMMVKPAIQYAKQHNLRVVMYCMDLWPASLCVGGIKKWSPVYLFYKIISRRIYRSVDKILVTSRSFTDYFTKEFGIPKEKIFYLPQYALSEFSENLQNECKQTTDFVFAGNIGKAQNIEVVIRAAKIIEEKGITDHGKKICFHIIGNGQSLDLLKKMVDKSGVHNVTFYGRKPQEEMPQYYAMADAMLVTLTPDPLVSLTLPAKVQSYLAAGKPVIACANGEIAKVVEESGCGFCARGDDETDLVKCIDSFINCESRVKLSKMARRYYEKHFFVERVMDDLEKVLNEYKLR